MHNTLNLSRDNKSRRELIVLHIFVCSKLNYIYVFLVAVGVAANQPLISCVLFSDEPLVEIFPSFSNTPRSFFLVGFLRCLCLCVRLLARCEKLSGSRGEHSFERRGNSLDAKHNKYSKNALVQTRDKNWHSIEFGVLRLHRVAAADWALARTHTQTARPKISRATWCGPQI